MRDFIRRYYPIYPVMGYADTLCELMSHDKKNDREGLNFTLLESVGQFSVDNYCSRELVMEALRQI